MATMQNKKTLLKCMNDSIINEIKVDKDVKHAGLLIIIINVIVSACVYIGINI